MKCSMDLVKAKAHLKHPINPPIHKHFFKTCEAKSLCRQKKHSFLESIVHNPCETKERSGVGMRMRIWLPHVYKNYSKRAEACRTFARCSQMVLNYNSLKE